MCFTTCGRVRSPKAHKCSVAARSLRIYHFSRQCFSKGQQHCPIAIREGGRLAPHLLVRPKIATSILWNTASGRGKRGAG